MEFRFYSINNKNVNKVEEYINSYNETVSEIIKGTGVNKILLIKEKSNIEKEIFNIVDKEMYEGILSEDEFDNINKEFKEKYLSSNLIKAAKLEDAYLDILECSFEGAEILKSIIKIAIRNKESLLFWIN